MFSKRKKIMHSMFISSYSNTRKRLGEFEKVPPSFHSCFYNPTETRCMFLFLKVAPYSFLSARALISKISRWRKLSNSTPKSRPGSRSKMPTNMASKLLKFVYRKCCVDRFRFQNICRLHRRPQLSLLDVKEEYTRHAGLSTNEADFM